MGASVFRNTVIATRNAPLTESFFLKTFVATHYCHWILELKLSVTISTVTRLLLPNAVKMVSVTNIAELSCNLKSTPVLAETETYTEISVGHYQ